MLVYFFQSIESSGLMINVLMVGNNSSVKGGITTVINQFKSYDWEKENINIKFIPTYIDKTNLFKIIYFLISYIKIIISLLTKKYKIVHIHTSYKGSFTRAYEIQKLCKLFKLKIIVHLHGSQFKKWYYSCNKYKKRKIRKFLKRTDLFIVLGKEWERTIKQIEPSTKTLIVENSIKIRNEYANYNKEFQILYLGVLVKRKGVSDLLESISIMVKENAIKNTKFIIAGSGEEYDFLIKKSKLLKIEKYVKFIGWVDEKKKDELLKKSQALILPSYHEGLPMCVLEAMSYGLPVISTNVGDVSEAINDKKNGYLISPGNIYELKNAIEKIINSDETEWNKMKNYSLEIIKEKFSDKNYYIKFINIYNNL